MSSAFSPPNDFEKEETLAVVVVVVVAVVAVVVVYCLFVSMNERSSNSVNTKIEI